MFLVIKKTLLINYIIFYFLRLKDERIKQAENAELLEKLPEPVPKAPTVENRLEAIPGVDNFQMKGAPPGTAIPGEKVGHIYVFYCF